MRESVHQISAGLDAPAFGARRADKAWAKRAVDHLEEQIVAIDLDRWGVAWASAAAQNANLPLGAIRDFVIARMTGDRQAASRIEYEGAVYDIAVATDATRRYAFARVEDAAPAREEQTRRLAEREHLLTISREIAVGEIATTLAHELNQPLGSVVNLLRGVSARARSGDLDQEKLTQALDKAIDQALYASQVVARIRSFVAARTPKVAALDLSVLLSQTLDLLDWEIRRDKVKVDLSLPPDPPRALGDPVMIQQVLVNLTRNGIEAMRTCAAKPELRIEARARAENARVEIVISDRGPGLGPEAALRLFSPFASNKPGGMGVGLSICRSIIELHRGRIWAGDNAHGGADFHILLPAAPQDAATHEEKTGPPDDERCDFTG